MKILVKTFSYYLENFLGISAFMATFIFLFNQTECFFDSSLDLIKAFPTIGITSFGFLLAVLSIILQGNGETITFIRSRETLYKMFIHFNKKTILLSFFTSVFAFVVGNIKLENFFLLQESSILSYKHIVVSVFFGAFIWFVIDVLMFIRIFYLIIRK